VEQTLMVSCVMGLLVGTQAQASAALLWPLPRSVTPGSNAAMFAANASFFGAAPTALLERAFERYAKLLPTCDGPPGDASVVSSFELRVDDPEAPGPAEFMDESYTLLVPSQVRKTPSWPRS
jgi:hypothetical protein